jgi:hypothetical protein
VMLLHMVSTGAYIEIFACQVVSRVNKNRKLVKFRDILYYLNVIFLQRVFEARKRVFSMSKTLKKCYRKGCQIFATHMEETPKDKVPNLEYHEVLEEFEDVFKEVPGIPPKRDIDFSINLMPEAAPVSKTPYRMSTPELKELQMNIE